MTNMGPNKPDFKVYAQQVSYKLGFVDYGMADEIALTAALEETYERGFSDGRDSCAPALPDRPCHCKHCGELFFERQLKNDLGDIPNLAERLDPGGEVPIGECPECGALAYLAKPGEYSKLEVDWLSEHVVTTLAKKYGDGTSDCRSYVMDLILGDDPHTAVAAFMTGHKPVEIREEGRNRAKTELYKLCYGGA